MDCRWYSEFHWNFIIHMSYILTFILHAFAVFSVAIFWQFRPMFLRGIPV